MAPPSYPDLGKQARELFSKGFHFGLWKLGCRTKTQSGIEFNTVGYSSQDSGKVAGSLESKYKIPDYGLTLTERWSVDNTLFSEVSCQDKILEGLTLALQGNWTAKTNDIDGKLKVGYGQDNVKFDADMNLDLNGPLINLSIVLGYENFLGGYQTGFDSQNSKITTNNFALGYTATDFILHAAFNNGEDINGSVYHNTNEKLVCGVQIACTSGGDNAKFGIAARYLLDTDTYVRAKINNASQIGLGYQQKLREGITFYLSTLIEGKNLNGGGHKIGVALELEA